MMSETLEFRLSENPWSPTAVLAEVNARTDSGLVLVGLADQVGGESSAAFVAWPDGRRSALIRTPTQLSVMQQAADVLNIAHGQGLPVPEFQLVIQLNDGYVAVVQERLPGRHLQKLDSASTAAFVATNERFADLLRHHQEVPRPAAFPETGPGYGAFEHTIGAQGEPGRRLLNQLLQADGGAPMRMDGDDLVHTDYSVGNVLFDESGHVTAVVDWNTGVARGDRRYALIGLKWRSVDRSTMSADQLTLIEETMIDLAPSIRRSYEAHWWVHRAHMSIVKGFRADRINKDLAAAAAALGSARAR
jgi:aminoglycoside phosphotransferase (APT) family kinase protein